MRDLYVVHTDVDFESLHPDIDNPRTHIKLLYAIKRELPSGLEGFPRITMGIGKGEREIAAYCGRVDDFSPFQLKESDTPEDKAAFLDTMLSGFNPQGEMVAGSSERAKHIVNTADGHYDLVLAMLASTYGYSLEEVEINREDLSIA
tara:strand:- start:1668 stop:2108 length:441 start_codon:yes stop_codon:yes gene_type:complete